MMMCASGVVSMALAKSLGWAGASILILGVAGPGSPNAMMVSIKIILDAVRQIYKAGLDLDA
eukprot:137148-Karenia_brevis.AAC.1